MNILVIGGAGYIGSHVVREFLDEGHSVTVFDNLSSGLRENLFPKASFIYGDILDYTGLLRAARNKGEPPFDGLIHLAAFKAAGESMIKPQKYSMNNISGTINILNVAVEAAIRKFVFSSSAAVYGEPTYLPLDEKHPTAPENYYGFTKCEIERFLEWYDRLKHIRFASLRYFNAAGYDVHGRITGLEQRPANLLPVVMEAALGKRPAMQVFGNDYATPDGTCIRDYVHVSDLAAGHLSAMHYLATKKQSLIVNLGSEAGFSVLDVIAAARRITGKPIPVTMAPRRPGDPACLTASAQYARDTLGWTAKHSDLDTLISTTWKAYCK
jgi:UDP-glucose 4-epimerase